MTVELLVEALRKAKEASEAADPGPEADGGSCNNDTCTFRLPRVKSVVVEHAARLAGVRVLKFIGSRAGSRCWRLSSVGEGQAHRNTVMVEAASKSLNASGIASDVHYFID